MARMINADALQKLCNKRIKDTWNSKTAPVSWAEAYADFKDDINSIPAFAQPGKPLTLEQLREMDGQPVWIVEYPDWGHWELSEDANDYIVDRNLNFYGMKHDDPDGRYGLHKLGWLAYSYPPAHIDRSGWISVKERLPKTGTVLVTDGKIVITAPSSSVTKDGLAITHWMPLPEPPEEG